MRIEDVHIEFRVLLDKVYSNAYPELENQDIDYILNNTLYQYINTRYNLNNLYRQGFEQSQKRIDDLRTLVRTSYFNTTNTGLEGDNNIYSVNLKSPFSSSTLTVKHKYRYLHYIKGNINISKTKTNYCGVDTTTSSNQVIKISRQDEIEKLLSDPFNKPSLTNYLGVFENNNILVYIPNTSGLSLNYVKLTYLKQPVLVNRIINPIILTDVNVLDNFTLYEVVSGNITYNGIVYGVGDWFETTTLTSFIGTGTVRLFTSIELPEYQTREVIKLAVQNALEMVESPRQQTTNQLIVGNME